MLLRLWLKDSAVARGASRSIAQLVGLRVTGTIERRRMVREFERISEEVAERLEPHFETEFDGLAANEREAAARTVADTIDGAVLTEDVLFANDLDPVKLESFFRSQRPTAAEDALLAPAAVALYDFALREICHYLVEIVVTLPSFDSRQARELLSRETDVIELVHRVLTRLPDDTGLTDDANRFETAYRRELTRKLDRLELFGVTASELSRRYSLSVAYLMLDASSSATDGDEEPAGDEAGRVAVSVDQALSGSRRSLLRGEAGSGKTTVLQWLAVTAARREFEGPLEECNDAIPFFLKLRRFVATGLPRPDDFVAEINATLAERAPDGWIRQQLDSGRALVLIDGVDELPEHQRDDAREWLRDLLATYPDASYVVTSRPPAVSEEWLAEDGFEAAFLEPMDPAGTRSFIAHWHHAARIPLRDAEEIAELEALEAKLQREVRERPAVRNLATSPLLCALLCALNRDRRAQLPGDRIELYRIALEMLLTRREAERGVPSEVDIGHRERELILGDLAFWLLGNEMSDAERDQVVERIGVRMEGMHRIDASPEQVFDHLLNRSGLLRAPVEGRIDFIHRTFQEYLGAKEAIRSNWIRMLLDKSRSDQWREVIILAAGLGTVKQSQKLIGGLLDRGLVSSRDRHRLQLLAVACLETSPELPPELTEELQRVLESLVPPATLTEARALASAGDLATPLLVERGRGLASTTAASVRALGLIGTEAALAGLERYAADSRVTVGRELVRAWDFFPIDDYARRVLAPSVLDHGRLVVDSAEKLATIGGLRRLRSLVCSGRSDRGGSDWDWRALERTPGLEHLRIGGVDGLRAAPPVPLPKLRGLSISSCHDLVELGDLAPGLDSLNVLDCPSLSDIGSLGEVGELRVLRLSGVDCAGLPALPRTLETVSITAAPLRTLSGLERADGLSELRLVRCPELVDLSAVAGLANLAELTISGCPSLRGLAPLSTLDGLETLALRAAPLDDPKPLAALTGLRDLVVDSPSGLRRFGWLGKLTDLRSLALRGCRLTRVPTSLSRLDRLTALDLGASSGLKTLDGLESLENLQVLDVSGCKELSDVSAVAGLPALELLDVRGCDPRLDLSGVDPDRVKILMGAISTYRVLIRPLRPAEVGAVPRLRRPWLTA
jgi:hypothetical protein